MSSPRVVPNSEVVRLTCRDNVPETPCDVTLTFRVDAEAGGHVFRDISFRQNQLGNFFPIRSSEHSFPANLEEYSRQANVYLRNLNRPIDAPSSFSDPGPPTIRPADRSRPIFNYQSLHPLVGFQNFFGNESHNRLVLGFVIGISTYYPNNIGFAIDAQYHHSFEDGVSPSFEQVTLDPGFTWLFPERLGPSALHGTVSTPFGLRYEGQSGEVFPFIGLGIGLGLSAYPTRSWSNYMNWLELDISYQASPVGAEWSHSILCTLSFPELVNAVFIGLYGDLLGAPLGGS